MLKPLGDKIILKNVELEDTTKSGIVLPNSSKEKSSLMEVVALGDGKMPDGKQVPMLLKIGDKVVCSKYSGSEIKYEDTEYLIISQNDILAVVE